MRPITPLLSVRYHFAIHSLSHFTGSRKIALASRIVAKFQPHLPEGPVCLWIVLHRASPGRCVVGNATTRCLVFRRRTSSPYIRLRDQDAPLILPLALCSRNLVGTCPVSKLSGRCIWSTMGNLRMSKAYFVWNVD